VEKAMFQNWLHLAEKAGTEKKGPSFALNPKRNEERGRSQRGDDSVTNQCVASDKRRRKKKKKEEKDAPASQVGTKHPPAEEGGKKKKETRTFPTLPSQRGKGKRKSEEG